MPDSAAEPLQRCTIDYLQDTLLGVNPLSHACTAWITQAGERISLRIPGPWPKELLKAHTLTIKGEERTYHGVLVDAQASGTDELVLNIQLQPERPGAAGH
ncbi:hypothetical protein C4J87_1967 [Pseudomonas sp. R1-43-08]|uniref:hypothetical protein n=1 Tax=unclassified Pseudomonas TaxID=196821 RepID=UPI000F5649C1|nr:MULTISPECIES: hypothetical protein [unclassified Pseudomonas]AZF42126.1 hypothetical protein C4J87_1967 [Pseudomonas sp. R1-43-08]AZF52634.1 hypothetical protein C4J85_2149 [Pseudomonas sp. R4-34-07]